MDTEGLRLEVGVITKVHAERRARLGRREPLILWEGPCAYVKVHGECHEIIVFSSNYVTHVCAGTTESAARAESICRRLNAYPRQTRHFHELL